MILAGCAKKIIKTFHLNRWLVGFFFAYTKKHKRKKAKKMSEQWTLILTIVCVVVMSTWIVIKSVHTVSRPVPNGRPIAFFKDVKWQTGDILLYHSNPFINFFTNDVWSHVGLVVVGKSGRPRVFEITGTSFYATLNYLDEEMRKEMSAGDCVMAMRRVEPPPDPGRIKDFIVHAVKQQVRYEHVYWREFFRRMFQNLFPIGVSDTDRISKNSTVCSALISETLQYANVLSDRIHPLEVLPHDFGENSSRPLQLTDKYKMGPVTFLRMEKKI